MGLMGGQPRHCYEFDSFRLDPFKRVLLRSGTVVQLMPKAFDTLLVLVQNSGRVLDKEELMKAVWPNAIVEETNLAHNVSALRKALGEKVGDHRFIATISGQGYTFISTVRVVAYDEGSPAGTGTKALQAILAALGVRGRRLGKVTAVAVGILLLGVAGAVTYYLVIREPDPPASQRAIRSIAVLPFKALGAESDEYLGLGMADALITKLGSISEVLVRPTNAVRRYTTPGEDPIIAGQALRVDAVLDGNVQRSGERIRVTVQLVRVEDKAPLWAATFDEKFTDVFLVQDAISGAVARALALRLTGAEQQRLAKRQTDNAEAFQAYSKGRFYWNKRTDDGLRKGIEQFNQAIEQDPRYALAYAGLADCYNLLNNYDILPANDCIPKARTAALKALEIDEGLAEAHTSLALVLEAYEWDQVGAEREYRRALELNHNYSTAHHWYGLYLAQMGRPDEAMRELTRAQELEPTSLIISTGVAWGFYFGRQPDRSIQHLQKTLELDGNFWPAHLVLAWAYEQKNEYKKAGEEYQRAIDNSKANTLAVAGLGHLHAEAGNRADAMKVLRELNRLSAERYISSYFTAAIYAGLRETDIAIEWLEKAYQEHSYWLISIKVNPWFDRLRSDPRFKDLEQRIGFPGSPR